MFRRFRVHGDSMLPTLRSGQQVLACIWPYRWLKPGMIVLAMHPLHGLLVKRLEAHQAERFLLRSDNPEAETLGTGDWLKRSTFVARVLVRHRRLSPFANYTPE